MAKTFQRAETVICRASVKNDSDVLTSPATSFTIDITNSLGVPAVTAAAMVLDNPAIVIDGVSYNYHYDFIPAADAALGNYKVKYTATDGTRVTIQSDSFVLE